MLATGRGMTALDATKLTPPVMRLTNRIAELENDGVTFLRTESKTADNKGKYMTYHLLSMGNYHPKSESDHPYADAILDAEMSRL